LLILGGGTSRVGLWTFLHPRGPIPMSTIPVLGWIANAAARRAGTRGAVTDQAEQSGCSRQCVYATPRKSSPPSRPSTAADPPPREPLIQQNQALRLEDAQLWDWLFQAIEFPPAKQQEFAVTALAMGLSLNQTLVLLAIPLGAAAAPRRSTVHRWGQAAATAA